MAEKALCLHKKGTRVVTCSKVVHNVYKKAECAGKRAPLCEAGCGTAKGDRRMSAIYGAVALGGEGLPADLDARMKAGYAGCVIDAFHAFQEADVLMGCGVQYFTPEARNERLPIAEGPAVFTADVVLDNRAELLAKLGMGPDDGSVPDGTIAFEMVRRYGEDCLNELLGAYAFVYYDRQNRQVWLVLDAVGNRCLYYAVVDGVLYFSTLMEPLLDVVGYKGLNGRWITDFLALDNLALMTEYEETAYAGIYRLAPRQVVTFGQRGLDKRIYWNPEVKELKLPDDAAYAARLKEIYKESIFCLLRDEETYLMLSGGLDSTSIACYAARELRERGRTLHTFTSVPEPGYVPDKSAYYVADESESVLKTKQYLEEAGCRLDCQFIDMAGVNGWDARVETAAMLEIPYKSMQNILWITEGMHRTYRAGSRILLNGGFGNVTISAGGTDIYLNRLLARGRFVTFLRQCHRFARSAGAGRRREIKGTLKVVGNYLKKPRVDLSDGALFGEAFVNREMLEKHGVRRRMAEAVKLAALQQRDYVARQQQMAHDLLFAQKGEVNTKHSLATGVIYRDPTLDKRLVAFCMCLPADQFARDGMVRRLVREYMAADMPPHVLRPQMGLQSADVPERMGRHWERIYGELHALYVGHPGSDYVDCGAALKGLEAMRGTLEETAAFDILRICYTAALLEFIDRAQARGKAAEAEPNNSVRKIDGGGGVG